MRIIASRYIRCLIILASLWTVRCAARQDTKWLAANNWGNRYEGLIDRPNGLAEYKVLDLFGSTDVEPLVNPGQLHIWFYVPQGDRLLKAGGSPFRVEERIDETQYLMIPIIENTQPEHWNVFENWSVRDVIAPNHVQVDNLSIVIPLKDAAFPDLIAPAILYGDTKPRQLKHYTLDIYIERALSSLGCTVQDVSGKSILSSDMQSGCHRAGSGQGTPSSSIVRFTIGTSRLPRGPVTVHLLGRYANDETESQLNSEIHFYNEPSLPK